MKHYQVKDIYTYVDERDITHKITPEGLDKAIDYKLELQKENGRANWNLICSWLKKDGFDAKKCESFRHLVSDYQRNIGRLPKQLSKKQLNNIGTSQIDKEIGLYYLSKRDEQNNRRESAKIRRKLADNRLVEKEVEETIDRALRGVNFNININSEEKPTPVGNGGAMLIGISDWHIGSRFKGADYSFNYDILKRAVKEYLGRIKARISEQEPDEIYVASLGDLIENLYMRNQDQAFESEFDLATQQTLAIELISEFLTAICSYTKAPVKYTGIAGNHDRSNGNYRNNIYGDSFNKVLGAVVKLLSKSVHNLDYIEPDSTYRTHLTINGVNIKLIHGDIDNIHDASIIAKIGQKDNRLYQVLMVGHEHHYEVKEQNGLFYMIGSMKGADSYSDKLSLRSGRSQGFLWIAKDGKVTPEIVPLWIK